MEGMGEPMDGWATIIGFVMLLKSNLLRWVVKLYLMELGKMAEGLQWVMLKEKQPEWKKR